MLDIRYHLVDPTKEGNVEIRDAVRDDIEGIAAIYNDAVVHTTAIWNEATVDAANRLAWLADRERAGYPVLVAVDAEGAVCGYASFGDWRAWDGYRHTFEHSVYVRSDRRGSGFGKALMTALIERAQGIGKHVMVAGIEAANAPSIRLHQALGFERVGHLKQVGAKFGRWLDLVFLQLSAAPGSSVSPGATDRAGGC
jgi:L-amino acid N-acyltransferase